MGNSHGKHDDEHKQEEVTEYLDDHPTFLSEYIDRNPHLLDNYIESNVDEETAQKWLEKVQGPAPSEVLKLQRIDYLKKQNCATHHTDKYIHNSLVVRRAGMFDLEIYFSNRAYLPAKDDLVLEFSIGKSGTVANGTKFRLPIGDSLQGSKWTCMRISQDDEAKKIKVQVNIPADAIIGRYMLTVEVTTKLAERSQVERSVRPDVMVLFNPFAPADVVYMEDSDKRDEYVLDDTGIIYYGQYYKPGGMHWLFGQFEEGILDIALKLLRVAPDVEKNPIKSVKKRCLPVYCSRLLSAMVNCNDDDGVLYGRWDGEYGDGVKPTKWNGSVKILKQWNDTGMTEVKYGQCWVFSGVLTTVLRALGIPARSVTNFQSAHDTEYNMTIDKFVDEDGEESDLIDTGDSIWNFHVWNEGWFRRPDLPTGYDGWQAVDATPQEESGGVYQCGPAPVVAVKNGDIYVGNDTNFLFAEVNADRLTWKVNSQGEVTGLLKRETRHVGRNISTKAVGTDERHDITNEYKYPEGTEAERHAFERAYAFAKKPSYHELFNVIENEGDILITISSVGEAINGQGITVKVSVENTTAVTKTSTIITAVNTMLHNDQTKNVLKKIKITKTIEAHKREVQEIPISFEEYGRLIVDDNVIRVMTSVRVKETDNLYVDSYDVTVGNPDCLTIECDDKLTYREYNNIKFKFVNPLSVPLTNCQVSIEGSGVSNGKTLKIKETIGPNQSFTTEEIEVRPYRSGNSTLIADFDSAQIVNIKARKRIQVVF